MRTPVIAAVALCAIFSFPSFSWGEDDALHGEELEREFASGKEAAVRNEWKKAIASFSKCVQADPKWKRAWFNLGISRENDHDFKSAIDAFDRVLELDPKDADAWDARSRSHSALGDFEAAIADATKAIEFDPSLALAWFDRGVARQDKRDFEGAISDFSKALELDPKDRMAWYNRGVVRRDSGDLHQAISDFSKAIDLDANYLDAYLNRGGALMMLSEVERGMSDLKMALELHPDQVYALRWRSIGLRLNGDLKGSAADLATVLKIEPKDDWAYHNLALVEYLSGNDAACIDASTKSLEIWNKDAQPCPANLRWMARIRSGKKDLADQELKDAVGDAASPSAPSFDLVVAAFCLKRMSAKDLIEMSQNAPEAKRGWYLCQAHYWIGFVEARAGRIEEATKNFEQSIKAGKKIDEARALAEHELNRLRKTD